MRYSYKVSDAVHVLTYLAVFADDDHSSVAISKSINSNPSLVRSLMSDLRKAGLITTQQGLADTKLNKDPKDISLYDVYQAINMNHDLLHVDPKTNMACLVGSKIQGVLDQQYRAVEEAAYAKMKTISLAEIIEQIVKK